ncbi:MAG: DUF1156 domain-containing protein [bacterium]|nr:DUF1156 domain-containing protein [bacterium]
MEGYDEANTELRKKLAEHYPNGARMCDPFSGRAMISLAAARLGIQSWGIDYSPVATLAGLLLADYPMRDWDSEPDLPFDGYDQHKADYFTEPKLLKDVRFILGLIGQRYEQVMEEFYPTVNGKRPWGYVGAVTLPCVNCGNRFPLTGSLALRNPNLKKNDPGQSYRIIANKDTGFFTTEVHDGPPHSQPTLVKITGGRGKTAVCSFCGHAHTLDTQKRLMRDGFRDDAMLVVADLDDEVGKRYRRPTNVENEAFADASKALTTEPDFGIGLPAIPNETLNAGLSAFIGPAGYGYNSWGQLCNDRQTLGFVRLAHIINTLCGELLVARITSDYAAALTGYAASNLARRITRSTRNCTLNVSVQATGHIYFNDSGISHSFDYFETGCGLGPGTWGSLGVHTIRNLGKQVNGRVAGQPAVIQRGSAMDIPLPDGVLDAVVTDPPYDAMINYCDSSDLMYVWLKRALSSAFPWFGLTTDPNGLQEKTNEVVIKFGAIGNDHRTEAHYKSCITKAFDQARRKTTPEGIVTIVFGHGDPDAWVRVLTAIADAGLVLTGSWPCSTEKGGKQTGAYIDNTIVMACRPVPANRPVGDIRIVDEEIRAEIADRVPVWSTDGLADSDQRMAAIAPAMKVVGRYSEVRDFTGRPVGIDHFLGLAHKAVEEAADVRINVFRLADFDSRTRFALSWARQHGRNKAPASEARWQRLSYDMSESAVQGLLVKEKGGVRLAFCSETASGVDLHPGSDIIDIALAVASKGRSLSDIANALHSLGRENDEMLWAALEEMVRLVGEGDPDGQVWAWTIRNRDPIRKRVTRSRSEQEREDSRKAARDREQTLFG